MHRFKLTDLHAPLLIPSSSQAKMSQFYMGLDPLWAWVCSVLDPQDAIKELLNCVWWAIGQENGGPMWTAACCEFPCTCYPAL